MHFFQTAVGFDGKRGHQFSRESHDEELDLPPPPLDAPPKSPSFSLPPPPPLQFPNQSASLQAEDLYNVHEQYGSWNAGAQKPLSLEHEDYLHEQEHLPNNPEVYDDVAWSSDDHRVFLQQLHSDVPLHSDVNLHSDVPPDLLLPEADYRDGVPSLEFARHSLQSIQEGFSSNIGPNVWNWSPWQIFGYGATAQEESATSPVAEYLANGAALALTEEDEKTLQEKDDTYFYIDSSRTGSEEANSVRRISSEGNNRKPKITQRAGAAMQRANLQSTSFRKSFLPEFYGGRKRARTKSIKAKRCCPCSICMRTLCRCSCRWCYPSCSPFWSHFFYLVCALGIICGLAWYLWIECDATVTEGAFGLLTQTKRDGPMNWYYFRKVQQMAVTNLRLIANFSNTSSSILTPNGLSWYRLEMVYYNKYGLLDNGVALVKVKEIEKQLRSLAGWQRLCDMAPETDRRYCSPGDSIAAVLFGSSSTDSLLTEQGVLARIDFDGNGAMALQPLRQYLKDFYPSVLNRWVANSNIDSPIRSTFAFHLKNTSVNEWISFVENELQPALREIVQEGENQKETFQSSSNAASMDEEEERSKVRVFYRADYLEPIEFEEAVWEDTDWWTFAPIGAFVATLLVTRRIILAIVAATHAICAPVIATVSMSFLKEGAAEYPVIAVASWFIVAASCADLAIASESGWALVKGCALRKPPGMCAGRCCERLRRFILFLNDVPAPFLPSVLLLLTAGSLNDLPLVQEFSLHTGAGILCACILTVLVCPAALEVGDVFHEQSKVSEACQSFHILLCRLTPFECGGSSSCCQQADHLQRCLVNSFQSTPVRFVTLAAVVSLILGASLPDTSPTYTGQVPELFHEGHRLREGPKILALFGSEEMLGHYEAPHDTLLSTYTCKPDAHDVNECAWFQCEANQQKTPKVGSCSCYTSNSSKLNSSERVTCGAAARFSNLTFGTHDYFLKSTFWKWVEQTLSLSVSGETRSTQILGQLEMMDWQTGYVSSEPQIAVKIPDIDGQAPNFEDACLRVMCYCGVKQCIIEDTQTWLSLGDLPSPLARRLSPLPQPTTATAELFIVFGLVNASEIPSKSDPVDWKFNLDIADPWAQRGMLAACVGTPASLLIVARRCWILDFKLWLEGRGEEFPVRSEDFYYSFATFIGYAADRNTEIEWPVSSAVVGRDDYQYFWVEPHSNKVKGSYFSFAVSAPDTHDADAVADYHDLWVTYLWKRKHRYPALLDAWLASSIFATHEASLAVKDAARAMLIYAFLFCLVATFLCTWSFGLTFTIFIILSVGFLTLVFISWLVDLRDFGTIELLCFCAFILNLLPPLVRVTYQYSISRDGPGEKPLPFAVKEIDAHIGQSISVKSKNGHQSIRIRSSSIDGSFSMLQLFGNLPAEDAYLVDNRELQAGTSGLGYRLSPRLDDIDISSPEFKRSAPWGSTVRGIPYGPNWLKVENRFLPLQIRGVAVLQLQENGEIEDTKSVHSQMTQYRKAQRFLGRPRQEKWKILKDAATDYFLHVILPDDHLDVWEGCFQSERSRRLGTVLKRDGLVILGAAFAGVIIGGGMVPLRMEALGQIGLAFLCASLIVPVATLVFLPVLILLWLGPTRSRRRALYTFASWYQEGTPRYVQDSFVESEDDMLNFSKSLTAKRPDTTPPERHPGIIAALELGFPFSLAVPKVPKVVDDSPSIVATETHNLLDETDIRTIAFEPALPPIGLAGPQHHGVGNVRLPNPPQPRIANAQSMSSRFE